MEKPLILLPRKLPILRRRPHQVNVVDDEEYSLYFKNFIYPWQENCDVQVRCDYGANFGAFWRISEFPDDVDAFPLTVRVYDAWGQLLAEQSTTVELYTKQFHPPEFRLLCLGDSMTHRHRYVDHLAVKLSNVRLIGSRSFNGGTVAHEGRGGWRADQYLTCHEDWWGGTSPFVFPKNVSGAEYYGDKAFEARLHSPEQETYSLDGYRAAELREGMVYHEEGKLFRHGAEGDCLLDEHPQWEFSFAKYVERSRVGRVDAVSILLGANDLQNCPYEQSRTRVAAFLDHIETIIRSIHAYRPEIDVIVNMPVSGAEQFAWGLRGAGSGSAKMYHYNILMAGRGILERWDGREREHIHVSPMLLGVDPEYGFDSRYFPANRYSDQLVRHQSNWVHPNATGYCQMGDVLAAVVEKIRGRNETEVADVRKETPAGDAGAV